MSLTGISWGLEAMDINWTYRGRQTGHEFLCRVFTTPLNKTKHILLLKKNIKRITFSPNDAG